MANENNSTGRESDKVMLRLPDGMRDRLKAMAQANQRTMNAEIVHRLQASLDEVPHQVELKMAGPIQQLKKDGTPVDMTFEELEAYLSGVRTKQEKGKVPERWAKLFPNAAIATYPDEERVAAALAREREFMVAALESQRQANVAMLESQLLGVQAQIAELHNPLADALADLNTALEDGSAVEVERHAGRVARVQEKLRHLDERSDQLKMQIADLKSVGLS